MKAHEHYKAVAASDSRDRRGTLFLRDQIGALKALDEAALEPKRAENVSSQHDQNTRLIQPLAG
jgi:hypothetical protein